MISPDTRAAIAIEYQRGDLIKDIAKRHAVGMTSVSTIARAEGATPRFSFRAKTSGGSLALAGATASQRGAKDRLRRIKLMRLTMLRTGRIADRNLVEEIRL
jgi:hypothetical protein